ncbi:MAG: AI-2E family transporter [Candidatus Saccharimonadales bacterium]
MTTKMSQLRVTALTTLTIVLVITGCFLFLVFMYAIRAVLLELIIATIFAIALLPLVRFLVKRGLNVSMASVIALLVTIGLLLSVIGAITTPLFTQSGDLINNAPKLINNATRSPALQRLDNKYQIINRTKELTNQAPKLLGGSGTPLIGVVSSVFGAVSSFFVILVLALFILIEGPTAWNQFIDLLGANHGKFVRQVSRKVTIAISGFVNGNLLISLIAGLFTLVVLLISDTPYPFALAALVAIFDLIPLVGAAIATIIVGIVALSNGLIISIVVVALLLFYQFIEGNFIQPIVYGKTVKLSQLLIIIASIIGADLGGIIGVLLAIPIAAAIQIVVVEILRSSGAQLKPEIKNSVKAS